MLLSLWIWHFNFQTCSYLAQTLETQTIGATSQSSEHNSTISIHGKLVTSSLKIITWSMIWLLMMRTTKITFKLELHQSTHCSKLETSDTSQLHQTISLWKRVTTNLISLHPTQTSTNQMTHRPHLLHLLQQMILPPTLLQLQVRTKLRTVRKLQQCQVVEMTQTTHLPTNWNRSCKTTWWKW